MISASALNIVLSLVTIELMVETLVSMNRYGTTIVRLVITLLILAAGAMGLGWHASQWIIDNL